MPCIPYTGASYGTIRSVCTQHTCAHVLRKYCIARAYHCYRRPDALVARMHAAVVHVQHLSTYPLGGLYALLCPRGCSGEGILASTYVAA